MALKETLDIFGYKILATSANNMETLLTLRDNISNSVESFQAISINKSLKAITKESREFMKSHFRLHNICYLKKCEEIPGSDGMLNLTYINKFPYQLPIEKHKEEYSCIDFRYSVSKNEYPEVYFEKIKIAEKITELTSSKLTHEIVHTQLYLREGIINYFNNSETLSILLEIIHYAENCSKSGNPIRSILNRLRELIMYIDRISLLIKDNSNLSNYDENLETSIVLADTYIESILKAINLFEIYYNSNENTRKQMLNYIQDIFDANRSVEEFLEFYDTTFESSVDSLQKKLTE